MIWLLRCHLKTPAFHVQRPGLRLCLALSAGFLLMHTAGSDGSRSLVLTVVCLPGQLKNLLLAERIPGSVVVQENGGFFMSLQDV